MSGWSWSRSWSQNKRKSGFNLFLVYILIVTPNAAPDNGFGTLTSLIFVFIPFPCPQPFLDQDFFVPVLFVLILYFLFLVQLPAVHGCNA